MILRHDERGRGRKRLTQCLRILGILLLVWLVSGVNFEELAESLSEVSRPLLFIAFFMILPHVFSKVWRWKLILENQGDCYPLKPAALAYFGGIFAGLLTPGRLGEFVRAIHFQRDCQVRLGRALFSVMMERLFDLVFLLLAAELVLFSMTEIRSGVNLALILGTMLTFLPLGLFLTPRGYNLLVKVVCGIVPRFSSWFEEGGLIHDVHTGFRSMPIWTLISSSVLTLVAYGIVFLQAYLIGLGLDLAISFLGVTSVVVLGNLVALLPISISGIGTRDAVVLVYLTRRGVAPEVALSFSFLLFFVLYLAPAVLGAIAWIVKPLSLKEVRRDAEQIRYGGLS